MRNEREKVDADSVAPRVDENSVAFTAYSQAIQDAKAAIRGEKVDDPYAAATFINAIARKCSPHVYAVKVQAGHDTTYADGYNDGFRQGKQSRAAASPVPKEEEVHPEDFCQKCGRPNVVWFAPNNLWNKAVRAKNEPGILCPVCFIELAEAIGIREVWKVAPNEKSARKLTAPELNHLSGLLEARRDEGSYTGSREQYYARTERLIQWCNDQMKGQSNGPDKENRNLS